MGLSLIEQNYNFLQLTGDTRHVGAIGSPQPYVGGTSTGIGGQDAPARAVERLPKGEMVAFEENIPPQAGRERGISTGTLIA